ncbi:hypothetical protein ES703_120851 [subsurface metagenome]
MPELCRVLKPDAVLQLMFKNGSGVLTIFDMDYGVERAFQLYDEHEIHEGLEDLGMELIESESEDQLGGLMFFTDPKHARHCVFYMRKL